jgi:esterase/lipase
MGKVSGLRRRLQAGMLATLAVVAVAAFATAPPALVDPVRTQALGSDLDAWLASSERAVNARTPIISGAEKRIRWFQGKRDTRTGYAVLYLHGFSATRQEIAPVASLVADALQANLFETRLTGHGLDHDALQNVRAEDWLNDAAEALSVGNAIGEKIVLIGTSTGATLALAMVNHPLFQQVSDIVLISPNFAPRDNSAEILTWPGGPQLAYMVAGTTRSWTPHNPLQRRYWSTTYPMDAVVEMMRLVKFVRGKLPMRLSQSLLVMYSPADTVVDTDRITAAYLEIDSPRKRLVEIPRSGDSSNHVLAGDILSPENNEPVADDIIGFVAAIGL